MAQVLLANNAYTTLAIGCASTDTSITVTSSSLFPSVTTASGNWFYACFQDTLANLEIMKVTNVSGAVWTVTRAIGGTTARAFTAGAVIELRVTAETLNDVTNYNVGTVVQNSTQMYLTAVAGTNTITATLPAPFSAYAAGQKFHFIAAAANTGAVTININSVGAKSITKNGTTPLATGDITAGAAYIVMYDGTEFQLLGGVGANGGVNQLTQANGYTVAAGTGQVFVGPITIPTGQQGIVQTGGRLVIL